MMLSSFVNSLFLVGCFPHLALSGVRDTRYIGMNYFGKLTEVQKTPKSWIAKATYNNNVKNDGFVYFHVTTNKAFSSVQQAYSAGYLEGRLTATEIENFLYNSDITENTTMNWGRETQLFVDKNYLYLQEKVDSLMYSDNYWFHVSLILYQMKGIEDGLLGASPVVSRNINPRGRIWASTWFADKMNVDEKFKPPMERYKALMEKEGFEMCTALVKNLGDKIIMSHTTWYLYSSMIRILKKYSMPLRSLDNTVVPGYAMVLSSYPGALPSFDDFWITSQLGAVEKSYSIANTTLYDNISEESMPYFIRVVLTHRLSSNIDDWAYYFSRENMGTYNDQWTVLDYKKFTPNQPVVPGTLMVLEPLPGTVTWKDMSHVLNEGPNSWLSFNAVYFNRSIHLNNVTKPYKEASRYKIFNRDNGKIVDLKTARKFIRYNDYENDPFSKYERCPNGVDPSAAMASRSDLGTGNCGSCFGATDMKLTDTELMKNLQFYAEMGPTHDNQKVFDWRQQTSTACNSTKHQGQPERFDFGTAFVDFKH